MARQREGDTSTFHFHDNLNTAIRHLGRIVVDLIPKVYDSQRVIRVIGNDGSAESVQIDPNHVAVKKIGSKSIYNIGIGEYDVTVSSGPSYTTRRQEAAEAMVQMTQGNPQMFPLIGDLMIRSMDWPMAEEIADRLKLMLPPQIQQAEQKEGEQSPEVMAVMVFRDLRVPAENLVGVAGAGFSQLMEFFNRSRLHVCAQGVGLARAALEEAIRHVKGRVQFGQPLSAFQVTQFKIAEMATRIRAARNLYYEACWAMDNGKVDHGLIAMAKWYSAKTAVYCADEALQMHGGYGYIDEYKVQRLYRDAKILEIYEGTKEIEKTIVARTLLR